MKPSERIYKIWEELCKAKGMELDSLGSLPYHPYAIAKYLDECAEREDERIAEFKKNIKPMD